MTNALHQETVVNATPETVFKALTDADAFARMTGGAPAAIDATAGGAFSLLDGKIVGRTIELVPDTRLVQAWRPGSWEDGVYSLVRIELEAAGDETRLTLDQTGIPDGQAEHLEGGWRAMYWEPLAAFLA